MVLQGPFTGLIRPYNGPWQLLPFVVGSGHQQACMLGEAGSAAGVVLWARVARLAFVLAAWVVLWARVASVLGVLWARLAFVLGVLWALVAWVVLWALVAWGVLWALVALHGLWLLA